MLESERMVKRDSSYQKTHRRQPDSVGDHLGQYMGDCKLAGRRRRSRMGDVRAIGISHGGGRRGDCRLTLSAWFACRDTIPRRAQGRSVPGVRSAARPAGAVLCSVWESGVIVGRGKATGSRNRWASGGCRDNFFCVLVHSRAAWYPPSDIKDRVLTQRGGV